VECASAVIGTTCSGHGRCLTMREAGLEFNGRFVKKQNNNTSY
jgi:hypothetical protein